MTDNTTTDNAPEGYTPPPITGYRTLSPSDVDAINDAKRIEAYVFEQLRTLETVAPVDPRCMALARTHAELAFMYAVKAIARPARP